ncbi:methylmalonyl Co-A mutase-associated GTPase MeaB [Aureispira anguillae]|uniref:Methylmalonyl Co-A mutase-associated GTPase MeaB n=1 Tax=Aureispira anguillae TaxID=2864201 RepID=A0A915YK94_9BACT|nr:methylmalonyl Co-A mutase-associated GTPase MeaB [Aureispira anguillae]BDS14358.1 methylmalonyl Co-A mutase-associated GTPase MeaB [Aureispira anguillae]
MEDKEQKKDSALHISKGKSMDSNINKNFKRKKRKKRSLQDFVEGIQAGNLVVLSQAITLIESKQAKHQELAQQIIEKCLPESGRSLRIGLTGTPGVGKSTFIDSFGQVLLKEDRRLAVLAIDPSSQVTKGSILGDKTRMETLSVHPNVFIRPSAAGESLGGVARKTRESIILCEAAGFDTIIVETVGVGQSEVAVHSMVDFFLLLLLPNSGDELQGIKRGVMEMADLIAINKADGENIPAAKLAKKQCRNGLHLFPPKPSNWIATAEICSALEQQGLTKVWQHILSYQNQTSINGYFQQHRQEQAQYWLEESIGEQLKNLFFKHPKIKDKFDETKDRVVAGTLSPFKAGELLMQLFLNGL